LLLAALGDGHHRVRDAALRSLDESAGDYRETVLHWLRENYGSPRAQLALLESLRHLGLSDTAYENLAIQKANQAGKLQAAHTLLDSSSTRNQESPALVILRYALSERLEQTVQLALLALEPLHEPGIIGVIRAGFTSGDARHAANACEALCNLENQQFASQLHGILLQSIDRQQAGNSNTLFGTPQQVLEWCVRQKDDWLQYCARAALQSPGKAGVHA
jgi:hypothetical protein